MQKKLLLILLLSCFAFFNLHVMEYDNAVDEFENVQNDYTTVVNKWLYLSPSKITSQALESQLDDIKKEMIFVLNEIQLTMNAIENDSQSHKLKRYRRNLFDWIHGNINPWILRVKNRQ